MRTVQSQRQPLQLGAASSPLSLSMSPLGTASLTVAALLLLSSPGCHNAPVDLQQTTTHPEQPLSQLDAVCSSYLSSDLKIWASDVLGELCVLMLVQKSKELKVRENSKRNLFYYSRSKSFVNLQGESHPLHLVSLFQTRGERDLSMHAELQGPGGIQSRGFFLYRPRNGRRYLEYE